MTIRKHLLIGSGAAGLSALREIRSLSNEDRITIVSMEPNLPYSPTALPYLLSGKIRESQLWTADEEFFREMKSEFKQGSKLIQVAADRKEAVFEDGEREAFDTLLIATGSEPLLPAIPGMETVPVMGFHTIADYRKLVSQLSPTTEVLLYGGGLVAMGLASNLAKRGTRVKVVVRSRILRRYFDADAGALIAKSFIDSGVEIITGSEVRQVVPASGHLGAGKTAQTDMIELFLEDGRSIIGDILINCLGTAPRTFFLKDAGIPYIGDGIPVDDRMRTPREDIYAAGDVAVAKDFFSGTPGTNAILPSAVEQGRIAGANMAGEQRSTPGWISMNVFNFFGKSACALGITNGDGLVAASSDSYTKLTIKEGCLFGAQFVNVPVDPGVILYLIKERVPIGPYAELLFHNPGNTSRALMAKKERE